MTTIFRIILLIGVLLYLAIILVLMRKGRMSLKIFIDLVPVRCDFADLRDISTGHSVLYTVDGCVF